MPNVVVRHHTKAEHADVRNPSRPRVGVLV